MDPRQEEQRYIAGEWFDGVQWTVEDVHFIQPGDTVRKQFRKLLGDERLELRRKAFSREFEEDRFRRFLKLKEIEFTDWHERGLRYWESHPGAIVVVAFYDGEIIGEDVEIEYENIVVSQVCLPLDVPRFYALRMGHRIAVNLPGFWNKPVYIGYGEHYRYVNGH